MVTGLVGGYLLLWFGVESMVGILPCFVGLVRYMGFPIPLGSGMVYVWTKDTEHAQYHDFGRLSLPSWFLLSCAGFAFVISSLSQVIDFGGVDSGYTYD